MGNFFERRGLKEATWYHKVGDAKWWPGYAGQLGILYDEFRPGLCSNLGKLSWLLTFLDPLSRPAVEFKGGYTPILAKLIVITSNVSPLDMYAKKDDRGVPMYGGEHLGQLIRRVDYIFELQRSSFSTTSNIIDRTAELYQKCGLTVGWSRTIDYKPADLMAFTLQVDQQRRQLANGEGVRMEQQHGGVPEPNGDILEQLGIPGDELDELRMNNEDHASDRHEEDSLE